MTSTDIDTDTDAVDRPSTLEDVPIDRQSDYEHVVVENEDAPDECAIFPRNASEAELMTTWITAHGDAFVDLDSMR